MNDQTHELHDLLGRVPLFSGLSRKQSKRLLAATKQVQHPAGHERATEGKGALGLHLLMSGAASVSVRGAMSETSVPATTSASSA